jgi:hypothetical protein
MELHAWVPKPTLIPQATLNSERLIVHCGRMCEWPATENAKADL